MSNELCFQLFLGLPLEEAEIPESQTEVLGLVVFPAGRDVSGERTSPQERGFVGLPVGEELSWEGRWAEDVGQEVLGTIRDRVEEGLREGRVTTKPRLYWLVNFH